MLGFLSSHNADRSFANRSFAFHLYRRDQVRVIAQFRMGCHWLNSEQQRMVDGKPLLRSCRLCPCCGHKQREDEMHVFECPYYNDIRLRFKSLFSYFEALYQGYEDSDLTVWNIAFRNDSHMHMMMNGSGCGTFWNMMADFLLSCKKHRQKRIQGTMIT